MTVVLRQPTWALLFSCFRLSATRVIGMCHHSNLISYHCESQMWWHTLPSTQKLRQKNHKFWTSLGYKLMKYVFKLMSTGIAYQILKKLRWLFYHREEAERASNTADLQKHTTPIAPSTHPPNGVSTLMIQFSRYHELGTKPSTHEDYRAILYTNHNTTINLQQERIICHQLKYGMSSW